MAKEISSADSLLPLHEVLENEFVALHGQLPADYPDSAESETRLKAFCAAVHGLKEKRAALCISGGGIRSATFGLGILQGLARYGLLDKFHYLSTVSGGGYIGSWLSAWVKNSPDGIRSVVSELKRQPYSPLEPEPWPICYLREFSNYLSPRTGLTSVDFWTLIATFVRNIFLNWLVLISWLAAAMMVPRLYLAAINLQPDWNAQGVSVQRWDIGLVILSLVAFGLIAVAMAYAIVDVPSSGNARFRQRSFLKYRQLPLVLAALILAEWWAVFCSVHGSESFQHGDGFLKFVTFFVGSYVCGGLLGTVMLFFRKQRGRSKGLPASLWRFGAILLITAFAAFCLWAMATRMFLDTDRIEFKLQRDCAATLIPTNEKITLPEGTQGTITRIIGGKCETPTDQGRAVIAQEDFGALQQVKPKPNGKLPERYPLPAPAKHALNYVCFAPALILAVVILVNFVFTGLTSWVSQDEDREWWARSAAWTIITLAAWIVINMVVLWGAQAITATTTGNQLQVFLGQIQANPIAKAILGTFGGVTGIVAALLAFRSKLSKTLGKPVDAQWPLTVAAVVFFVLLSIVISWVLLVIGSQPWAERAATWALRMKPSSTTDPNYWRVQLFVVFLLTGVTLVFGIVMGFFINANKFSLHATYRNRLIRAYLAASRATRNPSRFTGFDPEDNFALCELRAEKPLHIINGALNLVKGEQLAWQERKAESFTMSRLHCGSWHVGYRPSARYGNGITLGTAMAISGAAANPAMGYHTSSVLGFLMTLFNLRLGWWLGNPGSAGQKTWTFSGPGYSVGPLFSEAVGNTTDNYKYVNLSDGGHFENLGLYEMVLRRCHFVVVSDAGQDPECSFADLGEAVRKIRIDFGIPIEFSEPPMSIYPRSMLETLKAPGHNCAIGRIRYSIMDGEDAPDGVIVYIKPACYGDEPRDIYEYFKRNPAFPHEPTANQFFSESQFESYRMLGAYTMDKLCTDCGGDFRIFIRDILERHLKTKAPDWLARLLRRRQPSIWRTF